MSTTYSPRCHIVDAAAAGTVLVSVEHDHEDGRGGLLRLPAEALAQLPAALVKAIAARQAGER